MTLRFLAKEFATSGRRRWGVYDRVRGSWPLSWGTTGSCGLDWVEIQPLAGFDTEAEALAAAQRLTEAAKAAS